MKCIICKKKAKWRYSPDLDIQGIGACSKHKQDVYTYYYVLLTNDEKMFWSLIKAHKDYKAYAFPSPTLPQQPRQSDQP